METFTFAVQSGAPLRLEDHTGAMLAALSGYEHGRVPAPRGGIKVARDDS